jgi:dienelactone hydrolase
MKQLLVIWLGLVLIVGGAQATVRGKVVEYSSNGIVMKGYLAYDDALKDKRPGVLVVHEWWGHNDYARERAKMLAEMGYVALAVDMYGDGKQAAHPKDAGKFAGEVRSNMPEAEKRFRAALELLRKDPHTDAQKIAAIGYCFGGGIVLEMARRGVDLDGVVSFHGSLVTNEPAKPGAVKAKVLVLNGAADPFVKPEQIDAFKKEMKAAGVDYTFINYAGAKHAFTNPGATKLGKQFEIPLEYNVDADQQSWRSMQEFFKRIFS